MTNALITRFASDVVPAKAAVVNLTTSIATNMAAIAASASAASTSTGQSFAGMAVKVGASAIAIKLAWIGAFAAVALGVKQALEAFKDWIKIGETASKFGISTDFAQQFTNAMGKVKLSAEDGKKALENAFEAITERFGQENKSPIGDQMQKLLGGEFLPNFTSDALKAFIAATTVEAKILAVVAAMRELVKQGQEAAAIDLGKRLLGTEFEDKLRRASDLMAAIDGIEKKLTDTRGQELIAEADIKRAADLTERLEKAHKVMHDLFKVQINLANAGANLQEFWVLMNEAVAKIAKTADDLLTSLTNFLVPSWLKDLMWAINVFVARGVRGPETTQMRDPGERDWVAGMPRDPTGRVGARGKFELPPKDAQEAKERLDAVEQYLVTLERTTDELKIEMELEGEIGERREFALALARADAAAKRAGRVLTDEEVAKVGELGEAVGRLKGQLADLRQSQRAIAEGWRHAGDMAVDALDDMKLNMEDVTRIAGVLRRELLRAAFTGQGWLAPLLGLAPNASQGPNALGGLAGLLRGFSFGGGGKDIGTDAGLFGGFAGGFAHGGTLNPGEWGLVGEHGPEIARGGTSGMTISPLGRAPVVNIYPAAAGETFSVRQGPNGSIDLVGIMDDRIRGYDRDILPHRVSALLADPYKR